MDMKRFCFVVCIALLSHGCIGFTRSVVDIEVDSLANPAGTKVVVLGKITDNREFRFSETGEGIGASVARGLLVGPGGVSRTHARIPSLETYKDFKNAKIRERAIGRFYNQYGNPFAAVLLPEGRTVQDIIRGVLKAALQEAGYRVVDVGASEAAGAPVLDAEIHQYWAWTVYEEVGHESSIELKGKWPKKESEPSILGASVSDFTLIATDGVWKSIVKKGNARLRENVTTALQ